MAQTRRAVDPVACSVGPPVGDNVRHPPQERAVRRAAVKIIDPRNPAHITSESKEGGKVPGHLWTVAHHPSLGLDPGMCLKGGRLLADADQEFR